MSKRGKIIILSGPSGTGKSTIRDRVVARLPVPLHLSISATTRPPRPGEREGVDYYFFSEETFQKHRQAGDFLECKQVFGKNIWYGTLRSEVEPYLQSGKWVMLEIDVDGAADVLRDYPDAVTIFIMPPSQEVLEQRLRSRGTESEESILRRLARAEYEIGQSSHYRYPLINGDLEEAVVQFCQIIQKESGETWND
ncbi:MAG: guanylate kinase [Planctomycetia bacterium]|nr:guanylate kinase [Planctomycetia bacterium]